MFDGRPHRSTNYIYPYHVHPRAPCTGIVLGRALQNAYAKCQMEAALVLSQTWNFYGLDPAGHYDTVAPRIISTSLTPLAEGIKRLDGTHLVCRAQYLMLNATDLSEVRHRIVVVGNSVTTTGETLVERIDPQEFSGVESKRREALASNYAKMVQGYAALTESVFEVALDPDQIGYECTIQVQACITNSAGSQARQYFPAFLVIHQEVR